MDMDWLRQPTPCDQPHVANARRSNKQALWNAQKSSTSTVHSADNLASKASGTHGEEVRIRIDTVMMLEMQELEHARQLLGKIRTVDRVQAHFRIINLNWENTLSL